MEQPRFATERLVLRPRNLGDLEASIEINSDPAVMRFLGPVWPVEQQRRHLSKQIRDDLGEGLGHWAILPRGSDEMLGWIMLAQNADSDEPELGYRLKRSAWGQGIATEAARVVLDYGLIQRRLGSAVAIAHRDNSGSHNVLCKLGFELVAPFSRGPMPELLFRCRV